MSFFKLLRYDLRFGLLRWRCLAVLPVSFVLAWQFDRFSGFLSEGGGSITDCMVFILRGMGRVEMTEVMERFQVPFSWLLVFGVCLLANLDYASDDLSRFGLQIIVRSGSRVKWWLSKCVWNICASVQCAVLLLLGLLLASAFGLLRPTFECDEELVTLLLSEVLWGAEAELSTRELVMQLVLCPMAVLAALELIQMLLSLYIKPVFSFLAILAVLTASAYCASPLLIGNYAMLLRSDAIVSGGVSAPVGLALCLAAALAAVAAGAMLIKHRGLLDLDE